MGTITKEQADAFSAWADAKIKLDEARGLEGRLRKEFADMFLKDVVGPKKVELTNEDFEVTITQEEVLKISDKDGLLAAAESVEMWAEEGEENILKIKPDITLARAKKLSPTSPLWDYLYIDVSPTPKISVKPRGF